MGSTGFRHLLVIAAFVSANLVYLGSIEIAFADLKPKGSFIRRECGENSNRNINHRTSAEKKLTLDIVRICTGVISGLNQDALELTLSDKRTLLYQVSFAAAERTDDHSIFSFSGTFKESHNEHGEAPDNLADIAKAHIRGGRIESFRDHAVHKTIIVVEVPELGVKAGVELHHVVNSL